MRITALLQKIHELASQAEDATVLDIDLMLDYTRVLYSDLLEWRGDAVSPRVPEPPVAQVTMPAPPPVPVLEEEPVILNGNTAPLPQPAAPLSSPGSPTVQQTNLQFAAPDPDSVPEPEQETIAPSGPKEPTLEEYLARQRELEAAGDDLEAEEPEESGTLAAAINMTAPPPVAVQRVEAPAATPLPTPPPQPRDIRTMIGINDKYQIMSELFGNDKAAYEQALDFINRAESEQAAFNWLRERLWVTEDHSDAAMIFFDVVRRFKNG